MKIFALVTIAGVCSDVSPLHGVKAAARSVDDRFWHDESWWGCHKGSSILLQHTFPFKDAHLWRLHRQDTQASNSRFQILLFLPFLV